MPQAGSPRDGITLGGVVSRRREELEAGVGLGAYLAQLFFPRRRPPETDDEYFQWEADGIFALWLVERILINSIRKALSDKDDF